MSSLDLELQRYGIDICTIGMPSPTTAPTLPPPHPPTHYTRYAQSALMVLATVTTV